MFLKKYESTINLPISVCLRITSASYIATNKANPQIGRLSTVEALLISDQLWSLTVSANRATKIFKSKFQKCQTIINGLCIKLYFMTQKSFYVWKTIKKYPIFFVKTRKLRLNNITLHKTTTVHISQNTRQETSSKVFSKQWRLLSIPLLSTNKSCNLHGYFVTAIMIDGNCKTFRRELNNKNFTQQQPLRINR